MEQKDFWIVGKHAVCEAIKNKKEQQLTLRFWSKTPIQLKLLHQVNLKLLIKAFLIRYVKINIITIKAMQLKLRPFKKLNLKENVKNIKDILILNDINDQRNVGSILRNCLAFNIRNIIIPNKFYKANSMGLYITAAGSVEKINIYDVTNISNSIRLLKENDFWIVGFDQNSNDTIEKFSFNKKNALILGSEGFGIKQLVKSQCDHILKIDISNELESLNVSNASAVILYELAKKNRPN